MAATSDMSSESSRPVQWLLVLLVVGMALDISISTTRAAVSGDGLGDGLRWLVDESGYVAACLGCLLAAIVVRWRSRNGLAGSRGAKSDA
jgi:hypothetical protein